MTPSPRPLDAPWLARLLGEFREQWPDAEHLFLNGHCHDFALGVAQFLARRDIDSRALVLGNQPAGDTAHPIFYAHTALVVGDFALDISAVQPAKAFAREAATRYGQPPYCELACRVVPPSGIFEAIRGWERQAGIPKSHGTKLSLTLAKQVTRGLEQIAHGKPLSLPTPHQAGIEHD
jgi:hypothetical protein